MKRSKKVIFAAHCLLNQNARAQTVAKCPGAVKEFLQFCVDNDYGIVPINCPQLMFEPLDREAETKEFYNTPEARDISRQVAEKLIAEIKMYQQNGYEVGGIYGVEGSPTCGAVRTHVRGEGSKALSVQAPGIFFEELQAALARHDLKVAIYDWDIQAKTRLSAL